MNDSLFDLESEDGHVFPLPDLPCTVGRGSNSDLQIDRDRISREHARLEAHHDGLLITDLDSTNGTFVNNERINLANPIKPGDRIHLANHAFTLRHRHDTDTGLKLLEPQPVPTRSGDTVIGFTALPSGFPVQAPEFFELLNDGQIGATRQAIKAADGKLVAESLSGRSLHPGLAADARGLFRLAEQLGEEIRLAELIRSTCLAQADQAGLHASLFLKVHPVECEEIGLLSDALAALVSKHRHLALVFDLPLASLPESHGLAKMQERLAAGSVELCGSINEPVDEDRLAAHSQSLAYVRMPASGGPERVAKVAAVVGPNCRILVDKLAQPGQTEALVEAGASLFQGQAIEPREDL